jgi:hypothetical protein
MPLPAAEEVKAIRNDRRMLARKSFNGTGRRALYFHPGTVVALLPLW